MSQKLSSFCDNGNGRIQFGFGRWPGERRGAFSGAQPERNVPPPSRRRKPFADSLLSGLSPDGLSAQGGGDFVFSQAPAARKKISTAPSPRQRGGCGSLLFFVKSFSICGQIGFASIQKYFLMNVQAELY
jgi:hypothetical protein